MACDGLFRTRLESPFFLLPRPESQIGDYWRRERDEGCDGGSRTFGIYEVIIFTIPYRPITNRIHRPQSTAMA